MEFLLETLNDEWQKSDADTLKGLEDWMIGRHETLPDGRVRYAIRDLNGRRKVVYLSGFRTKDPLFGVANCQLKLDGDQVIGINVEGDCATRDRKTAPCVA